jgi:hypothetical protein
VECGNASILTCERYRGHLEGICFVSYFIYEETVDSLRAEVF